MVFSSHIFLFYFLPLALLLYYALPRRARHLVLTLLSYFFYGWSNPAFCVLMLASTCIDFWAGRTIARRGLQGPRDRFQKRVLALSVISNLTLLGIFKYFNFGLENYNALLEALGLERWRWDTLLRVTLPLGISFYTFQSISYSVDVYRGQARAIGNFIDFACYVSMFPQLVAGPIVRFHEISGQLRSRSHTLRKFTRGVAFFSLGIAKKILLANSCAKVADICFGAGSRGVPEAWYGLVAYAFQIYFDFSGYSDMAVGLGLMLGFVFPRNFERPYLSCSITEVWRRWHMSLSRWLRDYLYIPLGGNRKGQRRTYLNLMLVMVLGGLWHGASWNFLLWGAFHGALLLLERKAGGSLYRRLPVALQVGATFGLMCLSWVLFRADGLAASAAYFCDLFGLRSPQPASALISGLVYQPYYLFSLSAAALVAWGCRDTWEFTRRLSVAKLSVCLGLLAASVAMMTVQAYNPFIYFIF